MWSDISPEELLRICNKDNGIYEVLSHFPQKVYFDIDCKTPTTAFYIKIIDKINELFPKNNMAVSGSVTDEKTSYRIILNSYLIKNIADRDYIKSIVKYLNEEFDESFDWKVYNKNRNMKAVNQSKGDGRIQRIQYNDDIKKHFITCYFNDVIYDLPLFEQPEQKEIKLNIEVDKSKKAFNLGALPKITVIKEIKHFDIDNCTPLDILNILPLDTTFNHAYTHYIARFCFNNNLSFEQYIN